MRKSPSFVPYKGKNFSYEEQLNRSLDYYTYMNQRRSLRHFSNREVPAALMEQLILTASTAPSGAHKQPWTFCLVGNPEIKKKIRLAAEQEEYENYHGRMSSQWLEDLKAFDTNWKKPFLETAPWLVIIFKRAYEIKNGEKKKNYYVNESVGLAAGFFLTAVHHAGLVALTHTPSPMNFLSKILNRPENERPFLLIPVGYPDPEAKVPILERKALQEVCVRY